jgi:hypothetical protein
MRTGTWTTATPKLAVRVRCSHVLKSPLRVRVLALSPMCRSSSSVSKSPVNVGWKKERRRTEKPQTAPNPGPSLTTFVQNLLFFEIVHFRPHTPLCTIRHSQATGPVAQTHPGIRVLRISRDFAKPQNSGPGRRKDGRADIFSGSPVPKLVRHPEGSPDLISFNPAPPRSDRSGAGLVSENGTLRPD